MKPMTAEEAALAEQAWIMRMYGNVQYRWIADELGFQPQGSRVPGYVAMDAAQRFDVEIEAGLRERPAVPENPGRGRATVEPWPHHRAALRDVLRNVHPVGSVP